MGTTLWTLLQRAYHIVNYEYADPRSKDYFLVERPFSLLALLFAYLLFVKRVGPWLMRDREPFQLRRVLIVYNILQILVNLYICIKISRDFWFAGYSWICEPIDRSTSWGGMEMVRMTNVYYMVKISDLLDTVFFVLRKKYNQITFLHVYHHFMMVILAWHAIKYFAGGHCTFLGLVNTFVHAVMYGYYLVTILYPHAVWWKKYVTQLQLVQHVVVGAHQVLLLVDNRCDHPLYPPILLVPQAFLMIWLFVKFYIGAYHSPQSTTKSKLQ